VFYSDDAPMLGDGIPIHEGHIANIVHFRIVTSFNPISKEWNMIFQRFLLQYQM
jgi:hypothetical protein